MEKWKSKWASGFVLLLLVAGQAGAQDVLPKVTVEDDTGVDVLGAFQVERRVDCDGEALLAEQDGGKVTEKLLVSDMHVHGKVP